MTYINSTFYHLIWVVSVYVYGVTACKIPATAGWGLLDENLLSSACNWLEQLFLFGELLLQFLKSKHAKQLHWTLYNIIHSFHEISKRGYFLFYFKKMVSLFYMWKCTLCLCRLSWCCWERVVRAWAIQSCTLGLWERLESDSLSSCSCIEPFGTRQMHYKTFKKNTSARQRQTQ